MDYDFSGWATRNNIRCSDGRTIKQDAFKHNDGDVVPLVWNHAHNEPTNVLGHALLENRPEGVYTYCKFNDTASGINAKTLVEHGDVTALSIYANKLKQNGGDVLHGAIREVSLVLAGANPGAYIDSVILHGEDSEDSAIIYSGESLTLAHAKQDEEEVVVEETKTKEESPKEQKEEETKMPQNEKTVQDVLDSMSEEQLNVLYYLVGQAAEGGNADEGGEDMKHNVFDNDYEENTLSHADIEQIFADGKRFGSLKESFLAHAETYGIDDINYLFPEDKAISATPDFVSREMTWVQKVMNGVHHTPFSRIKSIHADITADEARALGYTKGNLKKDEVFSLLKRTTSPTTIYKKQKLDRDDVVDITDFDVVSWLKTEMRMMLDEEIARAILVGDGRLSSSNDKINPLNIRPIWTDAALYTINSTFEAGTTLEDTAKAFIDQAVRAQKAYKGSGKPTCFMAEDLLTECLLLKDLNGHRIYKDEKELATAMRCSEIVTVPVMEGLTRTDSTDSKVHTLRAILVNLVDYNVGADKGGAVNMFDDFDIDYNAQKYLIETRCSGAMIKPYGAIAIETIPATSAEE